VTASGPGFYPEPPSDIAQRHLPLVTLGGTPLFRGHSRRYGPLHFNRRAGRFAPPDGETFGTLYLGADEHAAFIEAFSHGLGSTPLGLFISASLLRQSCLCIVTATRPLHLVDLTSGATLKRLAANADSRISDGPHAVSQRWAAALWSHPEQPDGLVYLTRNAPDHRSIALFDRIAGALATNCTTNLLVDAKRLGRILDHFGCALIP
jgi:hypothetical protein